MIAENDFADEAVPIAVDLTTDEDVEFHEFLEFVHGRDKADVPMQDDQE